MVRRLVWIALAAASACSDISRVDPGSTDTFYQPTGLAVFRGKLVVASSNSDLRFDGATGGSVISVDPALGSGDRGGLVGGLNIQSFAGELAIADPVSCPAMASPDAVAALPVRGENLLYLLRLGADGAPACEGCGFPVGGNDHVDPYAAGVACGNGVARVYVSHLRSATGAAWITQVDLTKPSFSDAGAVQSGTYGSGNIRGFAFDEDFRRVYLAETGLGSGASIRWLDLAGDCAIGVDPGAGGCPTGAAPLPTGLEAYGIALSTRGLPFANRRAYIAARMSDPVVSGSVNSDGVLLVADLVDDVTGATRLRVARIVPIGAGPTKIVVLPRSASRTAAMRDVVAVLAAGDGEVWLFDDETNARVPIGRDANGHPQVGGAPAGLAVDPVLLDGKAHLYVGSFQESFVMQVEVPVDDIASLPAVSSFRQLRGGAR
jgi:hypothetical protein